ncbi:MAG: integration host factor subunit beta [Pelagibacteraceae bacterium]|nr:integration host factor subunit beta [Pelagibacteraceae bacterium]
MSFVKSRILNQLANSYPNFLRRDLEKTLNLVLDEIIKAIAKGENVQIRGFGSFKSRRLKTRIGRNPKDGSRIEIPAKQSVQWKISKELFQKLNQDTNQDE